jgi:hypothetical protein
MVSREKGNKMSNTVLYKVLGPNGEACKGGKGVWHLPTKDSPAAWMPEVRVNPCYSGYHLCTMEQLPRWLGPTIWVVEGRGEMVDHGDKLVYAEARIIGATGWNQRSARLYAADCAEHVLHIFGNKYPNDTRPYEAIQAARQFANGEISLDELKIKRTAAADAADAAAYAADAAAYAAYAADAAAAARMKAREENQKKTADIVRATINPTWI